MLNLFFSLKIFVLVNTYVLLMTPDLGSMLNTPYANELIFNGDFQMYYSFTSIFLTFYFSNVRWAENVILLFSSFFRLLSQADVCLSPVAWQPRFSQTLTFNTCHGCWPLKYTQGGGGGLRLKKTPSPHQHKKNMHIVNLNRTNKTTNKIHIT